MKEKQVVLYSSLFTKEEHVEMLAKDLHRHYRAGEKSLRCTDEVGKRPYFQHDHGWSSCHRKQYFRQRATRELRGRL